MREKRRERCPLTKQKGVLFMDRLADVMQPFGPVGHYENIVMS